MNLPVRDIFNANDKPSGAPSWENIQKYTKRQYIGFALPIIIVSIEKQQFRVGYLRKGRFQPDDKAWELENGIDFPSVSRNMF